MQLYIIHFWILRKTLKVIHNAEDLQLLDKCVDICVESELLHDEALVRVGAIAEKHLGLRRPL
jgi:hypothetical protein